MEPEDPEHYRTDTSDDISGEEFAVRLEAAIRAAGHPTIRGAARAAGMHYETLYRYLRPQTRKGRVHPPQLPSAGVIERLVLRLGVDPLALFPGDRGGDGV